MSSAPPLPPLRDVIRRHGLTARKGLGQNFLLDLNLTGKIARAAGPLDGARVLEIGPGPGGLTRALLDEGAASVTAVERDGRCLPALQEIAEHFPGRLTLIHADALELADQHLPAAPFRIVANLPYNIATPLLLAWLGAESWPPDYQSMTLMFQREVAERLVASPGGKTYGRLSVMTQWRSHAEILFHIDPRAFTPAPRVRSSLVRITPRSDAGRSCRHEDLEKIVAAAFGQRRKMLRSSLKTLLDDPAGLLRRAGLDGEERAEQLSVRQFVNLAAQLGPRRASQTGRPGP